MALRVFDRFLVFGGAVASFIYFVYRRYWMRQPTNDILSLYGVFDDDDCENVIDHLNDFFTNNGIPIDEADIEFCEDRADESLTDDEILTDENDIQEDKSHNIDLCTNDELFMDNIDIVNADEFVDLSNDDGETETTVEEEMDDIISKVEDNNYEKIEETVDEVIRDIMSKFKSNDDKTIEETIREVMDDIMGNVENNDDGETETTVEEEMDDIISKVEDNDYEKIEETVDEVIRDIMSKFKSNDDKTIEETIREVMDDIMGNVKNVSLTESSSHFRDNFDNEDWRWLEVDNVNQEKATDEVRGQKTWRRFKGLRKIFKRLSCKKEVILSGSSIHFNGNFDFVNWRWKEVNDENQEEPKEVEVRGMKKRKKIKGLRKFFKRLSGKRKAGVEE